MEYLAVTLISCFFVLFPAALVNGCVLAISYVWLASQNIPISPQPGHISSAILFLPPHFTLGSVGGN